MSCVLIKSGTSHEKQEEHPYKNKLPSLAIREPPLVYITIWHNYVMNFISSD